MKNTVKILGVLAIFMFALVGSVSAATSVDVAYTANVLQTVSLTSAGSVAKLALPIGDTETTGITMSVANNVPVKLTIKDKMEGTKDAALAGKMAYWYTTTSIYNPLASNTPIAAKPQFKWNSGSYVTLTATATDLAASVPVGQVTHDFTMKSTVAYTDVVLPAASSDYYKITAQVDAVVL